MIGKRKDGGRGRNRTFNLSIKSRMLCQLSYASGSTFALTGYGRSAEDIFSQEDLTRVITLERITQLEA